MILTQAQIEQRKRYRATTPSDEGDYLDTIEAAWSELRAWRDGGLTEEILRNHYGYIKVGRGCLLVSEHHLEEEHATIAALEAERDALKARCEPYKEQKERPSMSTPYRVVKQRHACTVCGHGEQWVVEGPMGDMGSDHTIRSVGNVFSR